MDKNSHLVYSTNATLNQKCGKCKEAVPECTCESQAPGDAHTVVAVLRIEKSGRGGKTVTVIDRLPRTEKFLKELCTELKKKCGSGGTHLVGENGGVIEIQGDKRDMIRGILVKKDMRVKG